MTEATSTAGSAPPSRSRPVDVITVPDFSGPASPKFELRTLLFLGSWMRHSGASRSWPLHLACIGEPPAAVRDLAARAGASVTVHAPMPPPYPATANKLRGLEIAPATDRFLLLDTDVLVLGDLDPLARHVGEGIGAGPARFNLLSDGTWRRIFECVGVTYPEGDALPPYYTSGEVMGGWAFGLGTMWRDHIRRILDHFAGESVTDNPKWFRHAEQHGLATAVAALRQRGIPLATLPTAYQARPYLLMSGALAWAEVVLFHYVKVFSVDQESVAGVVRLLYGDRYSELRRRLAGMVGLGAIRSPIFRLVGADRLRAYRPFYDRVDEILRDYVVPLSGLAPAPVRSTAPPTGQPGTPRSMPRASSPPQGRAPGGSQT